ncbi:hypothetical protein AU184_04150 [Mycolicibacterium novocastrense]|nr:hypothetical protein AU184_04150 [Mycolicibacterium novocastrense]
MHQRGRLVITSDAAAVFLIVVLWCRAVGSRIVLSLTADKVFVPVGQDPIWPPAAGMVSRLSFLLAVSISVGIILFRINDVTRPGLWRIAVLLAPWLWILLRDLYSGAPTPDAVLYVLVVLAIAALRPHPRVLRALGALVVLTAVIAIGFGFLMPDAGILHDADGTVRHSDKSLFPSLGLLQGMFTAENNLGLYLSIGIAAVVTLSRWWLRVPGLAVVVFAIVWSSSRNSMFATACMLVVGIVVGIMAHLGWRRAASAVARTATTAAVLTMCALPIMGWEDETFTDRGLIWKGALTEWSSREFLTGLGSDWYEQIATSDTSPLNLAAFHGHNQFIQFLTVGGPIFAFLAVGSLLVQAFAITVWKSRYLTVGAMLVTGIAVGGFLDVPLGFVDTAMFWTVTIVPLSVLFFARPRDTHQENGAR